jgi:hypothetical protein
VSCFSSCFRATKKEDPANLISIDHKHFFPKEFMKAVGANTSNGSGKRMNKSGDSNKNGKKNKRASAARRQEDSPDERIPAG